MPLTKEERDFLDAYVYEAMHEPFAGPATAELRGRGLYYADLHGLLTAYHRELTAEGTPPLGKHTAKPFPCPWADRDGALCRSRALLTEYVGSGTSSFNRPSSTMPTSAERNTDKAANTPADQMETFTIPFQKES
jgi:hypothetical protein